MLQSDDNHSAINLTDRPTAEISLRSSVIKLYKMYNMYANFLTGHEYASVTRDMVVVILNYVNIIRHKLVSISNLMHNFFIP